MRLLFYYITAAVLEGLQVFLMQKVEEDQIVVLLAGFESEKKSLVTKANGLSAKLQEMNSQIHDLDTTIRTIKGKFPELSCNETNGNDKTRKALDRQDDNQSGMSVKALVQSYIEEHQRFSTKEVFQGIQMHHPSVVESSVQGTISRFSSDGKIVRLSHGYYESLVYMPPDEAKAAHAATRPTTTDAYDDMDDLADPFAE